MIQYFPRHMRFVSIEAIRATCALLVYMGLKSTPFKVPKLRALSNIRATCALLYTTVLIGIEDNKVRVKGVASHDSLDRLPVKVDTPTVAKRMR